MDKTHQEPRVLFRDEHIIAIDKPAGLLVHRSSIAPDATEFALQIVRAIAGRQVYPIHRLDRPTSGVLLFALDRESAGHLGGQFTRREVQKTYRAIVRGHPADEGVIDYPLAREKGEEKKGAVTRWKCIAQGEVDAPVSRYQTARYSLLELYPETGRRRQLRRHCAHIRHPIIGDTSHGDRHHNRFYRETLGLGGLFLFAQRLGFAHPVSGDPVVIEAETPRTFGAVEEMMDWRG